MQLECFRLILRHMIMMKIWCRNLTHLQRNISIHGNLETFFPKVLTAGEQAGVLTEAGAAFLDETGMLQAGIPLCPPEGDAGTGMTATNSVAPRTGNVSAGTSTFAMIVLENSLAKYTGKLIWLPHRQDFHVQCLMQTMVPLI